MLFVHQSNRLELLATQFSDNYAVFNGDPLATENIVVPNYGVARWLSLQMADHLGIAANLQFQFPAEFSWQMLRLVIGELPETAPFSPGVLRWRILQKLEQQASEFPELSSYLDQADQKRRYELACQLESIFDRYLFYRPQLIQTWESSGMHIVSRELLDKNNHNVEQWQARLWRMLSDETNSTHWIKLKNQFIQQLRDDKKPLPLRVSFFAVTELSPGYIELLGELSKYMDIHIYVVNPCQEFWSDIVTEKVKLASPEPVDEYLEVGNSLLASMGRQGRDFFDLLLGLPSVEEDSCFITPDSGTLLSNVQKNILELTEPEEPQQSLVMDDSISIHSCHSLMREAEVLHDQILSILDENQHISPSDIVVMTPDIEQAAPYIEAVFSTASQKIPFSIADESLRVDNELAEVLLALLELPTSRYEVNTVLRLLEFPSVRSCFNLDNAATKNISQWCDDTNIRWGIDAKTRADSGLPETDEHSWRSGLSRLLLGYMMNQDSFWEETLAYTEIEGSLAVQLGRFVEFAEKLFTLASLQNRKMSLEKWIVEIEVALDSMSKPSQSEAGDRQHLRKVMHDLVRQTNNALYDDELDFQCVRYLLEDTLGSQSGTERFLTGGVTICRLTPMRSIPFPVVCLMGMSDAGFPQRTKQQTFDLAAEEYWRGDRSPRHSDRYLFLESLLATREKLIISYTGQNIQSNEARPPSVLVNELLDYINTNYGVSPQKLIVKHPLQAFSPRYNHSENSTEHQLFTYANYTENNLAKTQASIPRFIDENFSMEVDHFNIIDIHRMAQFLRNPIRYFLQNTMELSLGEELADLDEREPFQLEAFADADIRRIIDQDDESLLRRLRAEGLLPHGDLGDQLFKQQMEMVKVFHQRLPPLTETHPVSLDLSVGKYQLRGTLGNLFEEGQIIVQMHKVWPAQRLPLWLNHLALTVSTESSSMPVTTVYTPDGDFRLKKVTEPMEYLEGLIDAYIEGQKRALRLFPGSGYEYVSSGKIDKARTKWLGNDRYPGEGSKEEYSLAFRGDSEPLNEEFISWSEKIYGPLIAHELD